MNASFSLDRDRIRIADAVLVYLERAQGSPLVIPDGQVPRSYGALPLTIGRPATWGAEVDSEGATGRQATSSPPGSGHATPSEVVAAPAMPGEAVWLGFQAVDRSSSATVRVRMDGQQRIDAMTGRPWAEGFVDDPRNFLQCPPDSRLVGRRVTGGRRLFGSDRRDALTIYVWTPSPIGEVSVRFMSRERFVRISGRTVEGLDSAAAYNGRRLP